MSAEDTHEATERRTALRALLMKPLLTDDGSAEDLLLIRRHREHLVRLCAEGLGYRLVVEPRAARLYKAGLGRNGTRPLRKPASRGQGRSFEPRAYALLCLTLAALTRSFEGDPQNAALAMELGELAIELEDLELASRAYRGATLMKLAPSGSTEGVPLVARAHAYFQLARIAVAQGDRRKARLMIDKAVADDATHEGARYLPEQLRAG